ncbi:MAG: hypothetical protein HC878_18355 [Leptolyngbyaceae cyanobacterium SL_5_14]|nr:hypothetical protein [Leptolyngbyaceae cyanobacterium SL_5_14]
MLYPYIGSHCCFSVHPGAAVAGEFSRTCKNPRLETDGSGKVVLVAECFNRDLLTLWNDNGRPRSERRLVISDYIANYNGRLEWSHNGNFHESCSDFRLQPLSNPGEDIYALFLHSRCGDGRGGYTESMIDLNEKISNQDGVLAIDHF